MVNSKSSAVGEPEWGAVKDLVRTAVASELSRPQGLATSPHALRQAVGSFGAPARQLTPFSGEPRVVGSRRTAGSFGARARQVTPFEKGIAGRTSTGARVATPFPDSGVAGDWQYVALFHHPVQAVRGSFSGLVLWRAPRGNPRAWRQVAVADAIQAMHDGRFLLEGVYEDAGWTDSAGGSVRSPAWMCLHAYGGLPYGWSYQAAVPGRTVTQFSPTRIVGTGGEMARQVAPLSGEPRGCSRCGLQSTGPSGNRGSDRPRLRRHSPRLFGW